MVPSQKKNPLEQFTTLQTRLTEAQSEAKTLIEDLSSNLSGAEIEVEKASMMTAPLSGDIRVIDLLLHDVMPGARGTEDFADDVHV